MISFSWEEGAQIVEDLENDKIDQVQKKNNNYKQVGQNNIIITKNNCPAFGKWPGCSQLFHNKFVKNQSNVQNRPPSGKRPGSSRPVSGALEHQRINHEEFSMYVKC